MSCSSEVPPPNLNRPQRLPLAICNDVDLDLRFLTTTSVRGFINCINGDGGYVQEYKDFLDDLTEEDLASLLDIYNKHMVNEARFKKALELYNYMQISGNFDKFMGAFASLTDFGVLQEFLPLLKDLYAVESDSSEPAVLALNKFLISLVDGDHLTTGIYSLAKFFDSGRARLLAKLLGTGENSLPGVVSGEIIEDLATALYYGIQSGGFQELSFILYDPKNYQMFRDLFQHTPGGLAGINSYVEFLAGDASGGNLLQKLSVLTRATDRPLTCFQRGDESLVVDNLFRLGFNELKERRFNTPKEMADFYIEEVPFHLQNLKYQCDLPPEMTANYPAIIEVLKAGYGNSLIGLQLAFDRHHRLEYLINLMTSSQIHAVTKAIANTSDQNALAYILDIFTQDLAQEDFSNLSQIANHLLLGEFSLEETRKWIDSQEQMEMDLKNELVSLFEREPKSLIAVLQEVDRLGASSSYYSDISASLRNYLGATDFPKSPSQLVLPVISKIVRPGSESRHNLKAMATNMTELWRKDAPALGDFFAGIAGVLHISKDRPVQEFLKDMLSDKEFVSSVNPVLLKILDMPSFLKSIELTAELGKNGEFSRLIQFFYELSQSLPLESLDREQLGSAYKAFDGNPDDFFKSYSYEPVPLADKYTSCESILSFEGEWNSEYLLLMAECFGAERDGDIYRILSILENIEIAGGKKVLDILAGFASSEVLRAEYFYPLLDELEEAYNNGNLQYAIDFVVSIKTDSPNFLVDLENYIVSSCENESRIAVPAPIISWLSHSQTTDLASGFIDLVFKKASAKYDAFEFIPVPYAEDDRRENARFWDDVKEDMADQSWREDERGFLEKLESDHRNRTDDYLYQQGLYEYPGTTDEDKRRFHVRFLQRILMMASREGSLKALWKAVSTLEAESFDWLGFMDYSTARVEMIPFYEDLNKEPNVRLASPLERAEILVQNSRLSIASIVPILGVDDVGTYFQLQLAKSSNLGRTLNDLQKLVNLGVGYAKFMGRDEKLVKMRNISRNFQVLKDFNDQGYLRFFALVYKELIAATPRGDRVQDRGRNYAALVHEPMRVGIFSHLTNWYLQLKVQGIHEEILLGTFRWFAGMSERQIDRLEEFLSNLQRLEIEKGVLAPLYEAVLDLPNPPEKWQWVNLMSLLPKIKYPELVLPSVIRMLERNMDSAIGLMNLIVEHPSFSMDELMRISGVSHGFSGDKLAHLQFFFSEMANHPQWLASILEDLQNIYEEDPRIVSDLLDSFELWRQARMDSPEQLEALREMLRAFENKSKPLLYALVQDRELRQAQSAALCAIAKESEFESLLILLDDFRSSEGFNNVFKMLRRHFKSGSL